MRIKLATTCNKNEQQQDGKNNAELWTKWTKKTGKPMKGMLDQVATGLTRPNSLRMMMMVKNI